MSFYLSSGLCCPLLAADGTEVWTTQGHNTSGRKEEEMKSHLEINKLLLGIIKNLLKGTLNTPLPAVHSLWLSTCSSASPSSRRTPCRQWRSSPSLWLAGQRRRARRRETRKPHPSSSRTGSASPGTSMESWWRSPRRCSSGTLIKNKEFTLTSMSCVANGHPTKTSKNFNSFFISIYMFSLLSVSTHIMISSHVSVGNRLVKNSWMVLFVDSRHDSSTQEEYKKTPDDVMVNYIMWSICGWVKSRPAIQTGGVELREFHGYLWWKEAVR